MKYLVVVGYDDVKLLGNDGDTPLTKREPYFQRGLGSFDNYAEAYGHAILHLNSVIDDWDEEERNGCTISRFDWLESGCFEMHIIGQKDNCVDWARVYVCSDSNQEDSYKKWYINGDD